VRESESRGKVERDGGREREKEKPERVGVLGMSREISPPFFYCNCFCFQINTIMIITFLNQNIHNRL